MVAWLMLAAWMQFAVARTGRGVLDPAGNETVSQPESTCVWDHNLVVVAVVAHSNGFCSLQQVRFKLGRGVQGAGAPGQCPVARPRHSACRALHKAGHASK